MTNIISYLKGKKTYILSVLFIVYLVIGVATKQIPLEQALGLLFAPATIAAIRSAIANLQTPQA